MRLRPHSIRGRDTVLATVFAAVVLALLATGSDLVIREHYKQQVSNRTRIAATQVTSAVRDGTLRSPIPHTIPGADYLQVIGPDRRVLNTSAKAAGRPPLAPLFPPANSRVREATECPAPGGGCMFVVAIRVTNAPDSPVALSASPLPGVLLGHHLEYVLAGLVIFLTAFAAATTWQVVGRTLRPVEQIRAQLAEITGSDLSRRVPQPAGQDEIAQLARTANQTLERLDESVARQRQFASDAAHELRTPITGLRVNLEDLAMSPHDPDLTTSATQAALAATDRLEAIVTDLLLLARLGTTTGTVVHQPVDLADLVSTELAARHPAALCAPDGRRPTVRTQVSADVVVDGVRVQLARLLNNLLDNAERHTTATIDVQVVREDGDVLLAVADDGPGVPEADRERIFERFTRLDSARSRSSGGSGLGLAIARGIATSHGGSLTLDDHRPGARFVLRLPAHRHPAEEAEAG